MEKWIEELLNWFQKNRRDFPWRRYRDWYRVLVAEVMLVRTRSEAVEKVYKCFLEKYPRPEDLCNSNLNEVEEFFKRLGIVQRARKLREAVCLVLQKYNGIIPCTYRDLVNLPGVGRYIAKVLLTRVCGLPTPFIDANIARFAKRFLNKQDVDVEYIELWLERSVPKELLEDVNIALLDFSSSICIPRKPRCSICILRSFCRYNHSSG